MSLILSFTLFFTHPLVLENFQIITVALVVGFTSTSSIIRPAIFPLILTLQCYTILQCPYRVHHTVWASVIGGYCSIFIIHYIEVALLSKWTFEACDPTTLNPNLQMGQLRANDEQLKTRSSRKQGHGTVCQRVHFGFSALFNSRMIGTPFEVKGIRLFSTEDPKYIPTRTKFLLKESMNVFISFLVLDTLTTSGSPDTNANEYSVHLVPFFIRLNEVTVEEIIVRIIITICFWISIYCIMQVMHSVVAIIAVASGLTDVRGWRPLFGPPSQGYTIRKFWR